MSNMKQSFVIAAAAATAAILFLIMSDSYSISAQNVIRTWGSRGTGDGQFDRPAGITTLGEDKVSLNGEMV
jgi:hypothetical protein